MNIIDIRNYLTRRKVTILEVSTDMVVFTEIRKEDGRYFFFLIEYDLETKVERTLINYSVEDAKYPPRCRLFGRTVLIVFENGRDEFWVYKVDKRTGEEFYSGQMNCVGDFHDSYLLDEDHILIYTTANPETAHLFSAYTGATGSRKLVHLYNLETGVRNLVKNDVLCRSASRNLHTYHHSGSDHLLIHDIRCTDEAKEEAFKKSEQQWHSVENVQDNIWIIPYIALCSAVEGGEMEYPLQLVASAGIDGWARFIGMDSTSIYYRCKEFKTGAETLFSYDKLGFDKKVLKQIDLGDEPETVRYVYDPKTAKGYKIDDDEYSFTIEGVLKSKLKSAKVQKKLGEYYGCIDDRFVVCAFGLGDGDGDQYEHEYMYTSLFDVRTDYSECVQGNCTIFDSNLILY